MKGRSGYSREVESFSQVQLELQRAEAKAAQAQLDVEAAQRKLSQCNKDVVELKARKHAIVSASLVARPLSLPLRLPLPLLPSTGNSCDFFLSSKLSSTQIF
jgi:hypothetical protein